MMERAYAAITRKGDELVVMDAMFDTPALAVAHAFYWGESIGGWVRVLPGVSILGYITDRCTRCGWIFLARGPQTVRIYDQNMFSLLCYRGAGARCPSSAYRNAVSDVGEYSLGFLFHSGN